MQSQYVEYSFERDIKVGEKIFRNCLLTLTIIFALLSFIVIFMFPIAMFFGTLTYYYNKSLKSEYEYILVDNELMVDKIIANQKRKKVKMLDLNYLDYMSNDEKVIMDKYKGKPMKIIRFSSKSNKDEEYALIIKRGELYNCYIIQCNEELLSALKSKHMRQMNLV